MKKPVSLARKILRAILYIILFIVFCLIAVSLIYYASGYRLDVKTRTLKKTGLLVINNYTTDAQVLIDGKVADVKTSNLPNFIPSSASLVLIPGQYHLTIVKNGFLPYSEEVTIQPELITKVEPIVFISQKLEPERILEDSIINYAVSPSKRKMAYVRSQTELVVFDFNSKGQQVITLPIKPGVIIHELTWNEDDRTLALVVDATPSRDVLVISTDNTPTVRSIKNDFSFFPTIEKVFFTHSNNNMIYAISHTGTSDTLFKLDTANRTTTPVDQNITWYSQDDSGISYFVENTKTYKKLSFDSDNTQVVTDASIYPPTNLSLQYFDKNNSAYIAAGNLVTDLNPTRAYSVDTDVTTVTYSAKYNALYYFKEASGELWQYSFDKKEKKLLTHFNQAIQNPEMYDGTPYIVYRNRNNQLKMIKNNGTNDTVIANFDDLSGFFIADDNTVVTISNTKGKTVVERFTLLP
ncbi:MAG: hypothetical protein WC045_03865 [Patescibacteria group bacterium]